ncbi:MAG TPA: hypothetical protein VN851_19025 [Thermoanaerobaculia bacterium]|nr:hypothetical protein [Thermoanaerobaculia bacterium]
MATRKTTKKSAPKARAARSVRSPAIEVQVRTNGPGPEEVAALGERLAANRQVAELLAGTRNRLLSIRWEDPDAAGKSPRPTPPDRFVATWYDYTHQRTINAQGSLSDPRRLTVTAKGDQPRASAGEFDEAVRILLRDPEIGPRLKEQQLRPYPPMPPLHVAEHEDGTRERGITVGLLGPGSGPNREHEIVGVNLGSKKVVRFADRAPANSLAQFGTCGLPHATQSTAQHVPGQVWITVKFGGATVWKFLAVRPAASSGTNGSGIELRYVDYKGKRVLYRGHVPILNVKYDGDACGPYRDWQNEESMIQAPAGNDVAPGFRICPSPAKTILDTGVDLGNYLGVGIYVDGLEVVLMSEMEAGWYRYISEWRLHVNGTIRPRFGFTAVDTSSCVCNVHHHHCYWRLDLDIATAGGNRVREFNKLPFQSGKWKTLPFETQRARAPFFQRKWRVENVASGTGYEIQPGPHDGVATQSSDWPYPKGDLWFVRYRGNEIDDGSVAVGPPYEAGIDGFVNHEAIDNADVVVWYGAHFTHDVSHEEPGEFGHIVGPTLKPIGL